MTCSAAAKKKTRALRVERKSRTKKKRAKKSRKTSSRHRNLLARASEITRLRQTRGQTLLVVRVKTLIPRTKMNQRVMKAAVKRAVSRNWFQLTWRAKMPKQSRNKKKVTQRVTVKAGKTKRKRMEKKRIHSMTLKRGRIWLR